MLSNSERFSVTSNQKLGFSSLKANSTCVGYLYVRDNRRSQTRRFLFKNNPAPQVGNIYHFNPYQTTFLFPIGIVQKDPSIAATTTQMTTPSTTATPTTTPTIRVGKFIGYNYTTNQMAPAGRSTIIHHGLQLESGTVIGFRFRNGKSGSRIRLQLWRKVEEKLGQYNYSLIYQTIYDGSNTGLIYLPIPSSDYFDIMASDKLGFTTEDDSHSLVTFHYAQDELRSQTIIKLFSNRAYPLLYDTVSFLPYQTTFLFSLEVELLVHGYDGATGPQGFKGILGEKGVSGESGDLGFRGDKGNPGQLGDSGRKGDIGIKGPIGFIGGQGPQGPPGEDGKAGQYGTRGQKGDEGVQGSVGEIGSTGSRGYYGYNGFTGQTGRTGLTGAAPRGQDGETGITGPIGLTGMHGPSGDLGNAGAAGFRGPIGPTGVIGPRGPMWTPNMDYCLESSLQCQHDCVNTELGAKCACRTGYQLNKETKCTEINECYTENGHCQYDCINTPGSYHCDCPLGLQLSNDTLRCDDVDECTGGQTMCTTNQLCINLWNDYYCAGPFVKNDNTNNAPSSSAQSVNLQMVTTDVLIGLLIWLIILSVLIFMGVIMVIPDCRDYCGNKPRYQPSTSRRPQFYYPAFFPRVSLDRRPSSDRIDIIEARQSRSEHPDRNETDGIINEAHIHDGQQRSEL